MKNSGAYFLLAALASTLAGCQLKTDKKTTINVSTPTDATKVLSYTNAVIDVLKKYTEAAEGSVKYYAELKDKIGENSYIPTSPSSINFLWTEKDKATTAFGEPTAALGGEKQFFADSVSAYNRLFKEFKKQDSALAMYMKAEDFKDDKFSKGNDIIDKQYTIYPQLTRLRQSIQKKIEKVADAAEEVSLKDSPIKDAYKAAKSDLNKLKDLSDMIADKEKYTAADLTAIDAAYADLIASIDKNKNADKSKLDKENKTDSYNRFYTSMAEECVELKPVIRTIKEKKILDDDTYDKVNSIYNSVVSDYNSWVN